MRSPIDCGVSEYDREVSIMRSPCPTVVLWGGNVLSRGVKKKT